MRPIWRREPRARRRRDRPGKITPRQAQPQTRTAAGQRLYRLGDARSLLGQPDTGHVHARRSLKIEPSGADARLQELPAAFGRRPPWTAPNRARSPNTADSGLAGTLSVASGQSHVRSRAMPRAPRASIMVRSGGCVAPAVSTPPRRSAQALFWVFSPSASGICHY
jgi:hypothetical protein